MNYHRPNFNQMNYHRPNFNQMFDSSCNAGVIGHAQKELQNSISTSREYNFTITIWACSEGPTKVVFPHQGNIILPLLSILKGTGDHGMKIEIDL